MPKATIKETSVVSVLGLIQTPKWKLKATGATRTSPDLIDVMLDFIPNEVWKNGGVFLDPACGRGTFLMKIIERLSPYHDNNKVASMIFGVDIDKDSVEKTISIVSKTLNVDRNAIVNNIVRHDFLDWRTNMKFDVVIGNPPYQNGKNSNGGAGSLWPVFIKKSFALAKKDGYVSLVTPFSWASNLSSRNTKPLVENDLQVVFDAKKYFTVGSSFSAWIAQKSSYKNKTKFIDYNLELDLNTFKELPLDLQYIKLLAKIYSVKGPRYKIETDPKAAHSTLLKSNPELLSDVKTPEHEWRMVRVAQDIVWYKGSEPKNYKDPKVVLARTRADIMPTFYESDVSTNDNTAHFVVESKEVGEAVAKVLTHNLYKWLLKVHKWVGFQPVHIFEKVAIPAIDVKDVYDYFNLTEEERKFIDDNFK